MFPPLAKRIGQTWRSGASADSASPVEFVEPGEATPPGMIRLELEGPPSDALRDLATLPWIKAKESNDPK